jgi:hypothetical protein
MTVAVTESTSEAQNLPKRSLKILVPPTNLDARLQATETKLTDIGSNVVKAYVGSIRQIGSRNDGHGKQGARICFVQG